MYTQQGQGGVYYSALQQEPEMHPLVEAGMSLLPYGGLYFGGRYLASKAYSQGSEYSVYDIGQKQVRNILNEKLGGLLNTLRIPEYASIGLSPAALELEKAASLQDPNKEVGRYVFESRFIKNNKDSQNILRATIGDEAYAQISHRINTDRYRLVYEQDIEARGRGSLFFEELDETVEKIEDDSGKVIEKKIKLEPSKTKKPTLISNDVAVQLRGYAYEPLDALEASSSRTKLNPVTQAILQNLDVKDINYANMYVDSVTEDSSRLALVPSVRGKLESLSDLKRRTAIPAAQLTAGIQRYNRLIDATLNQMPVVGKLLGRFSEYTGLSLKTEPGPFYKQFLSLGLKASKIGAVYMGLETVDHYRRKFGVAGNLVASTGISLGLAGMYFNATKDLKGTAKLGAAAFAVQMLLPGFNEGIKEGIATTAVNLDIARSYIGKYTGLSYIRRGIEGLFPGFTETTTGLFLGLGAAALSYTNYGQDFLLREQARAEGKPVPKQGISSSFDNAFRGVYGAIENRLGIVGSVTLPGSRQDIQMRTLFNAISFGKIADKHTEEFLKYNPIAERLQKGQIKTELLERYQSSLDSIIKNVSLDNLDKESRSKLRSFFSDNEVLLREMLNEQDSGRLKSIILDTNYKLTHATRSEVHTRYYKDNDLNKSLLNKIVEINNRYSTGSGFINNMMRRTEIFGAEMVHSFFGATLEGEVDIKLGGVQQDVRAKDGSFVRNKTYEEVAESLSAAPIVKRFGALVLGTAFIHQMMTGAFFGMMEDPDELKAVYEGEKLVEIKKGRWWEAGGTPYEGGETSYFRPHAYKMLMTKSDEKSVWGEDYENFNPITRFMLKNFTYYLEEKNYQDRPYPMTGAAFEDMPVLGPLLSSTIGQILKPPKLMHEDELFRLNQESGEVEQAYIKGYGSSPELGEIPPGSPVSPYQGMPALGRIQYAFREIEGLTGYTKNIIQKVFTGREVLGTMSPVYATSTAMDSSIGDYWEKELGGFGFMSEPIRRLFPRPRAEIEAYNPLINSMPSYIPEKLKRGDPYRAIANGSARLPGKGYEALNPDVAGLDPEDYPLIHKYKILADVAPQSRQTIKMQQELYERKAAGILTEHESKMLDNIVENHQKRLAATRDYEPHPNAIRIPIASDITQYMYEKGTSAIRTGLSAAEYLVPGGFRPASKLLGHTRDAIEVYETERIYGTANPFWDSPIRDWFRPAMYSAARIMGVDSKPMHVTKKEEINEHFDKLQFMKYMQLAEQAENQKDRNRYISLAARTRTGVNPNGDALSVYLALPNADKRFFDAFANAQKDERERILELVPEDQKHLYQNIWSRIDSGENVSLLSSDKAVIDEEYMREKMYLMEEYFRNKPMPSVDWIGWHKDVDIEDIKVKYVDNSGQEIHDYDMWESQVRNVSRKPYLEGADLFMYQPGGMHRNATRNALIRNSNYVSDLDSSKIVLNRISTGEQSRAEIHYTDDRMPEMQMLIARALGG
jgi:hypothetical protein